MKNKIYLFRHTESTDNKYGLFSGDREDVGLSGKGREDAKLLRERLPLDDVDLIITSPLKRCVETVEILLDGKDTPDYITDERIKERDYGYLEGRRKRHLIRPVLALWARIAYRSYWIPPPNGESFRDVWERVTPFIEDLESMIHHQQINVAICAHNNSMRPIRAHFENDTPRQNLKKNSKLGKIFIYDIET
jgi:broad specificity phosphatase PhoE